MGKLTALLSKNCNYIYHMLSVSNCGYENEYGEKYKAYHDKTDLQKLKKWERHITVAGGEHCGELYGICVSIPASFDGDAMLPEYFEALKDMYGKGDLEQNFKKYREIYKSAFSFFGITASIDSLKSLYDSTEHTGRAIVDISEAMLNNYQIYGDKIWDTSKTVLAGAVDGLNRHLAKAEYIGEWEKLTGCKYTYDNFYAVICNSIQNGPQCVDISYDKDVFYLPGDYSSAVRLISHEFGIYLLKEALSDTPAFRDRSYYKITESLAEYFNILISGGHTDFDWYKEYLDFYGGLKGKNPEMTARDMFSHAADFFLNV